MKLTLLGFNVQGVFQETLEDPLDVMLTQTKLEQRKIRTPDRKSVV